MYERTKYEIGHIHDCSQMHPNYVDDFYEVVTEVYSEIDWPNIMKNLFFEPMQEGMLPTVKEKMNKLEADFYKSMTPVVVDKNVFNPRYAYVLEGSVKDIDVWEMEQKSTSS